MDGPVESRAQLLALVWGYRISQAIYVVTQLGIPDLLADGSREIDELARATESHAPSLRRVLLFLAGRSARQGRATALRSDADECSVAYGGPGLGPLVSLVVARRIALATVGPHARQLDAWLVAPGGSPGFTGIPSGMHHQDRSPWIVFTR